MNDQHLKWLLQQIKKDDQVSFRALFDHFFPRFFRVAHYYLRNDENAEEVVMDVFARLWENRKKLPGIKNFDSYGFTVVKHTALNCLKQNNIKKEELDEYISSKLIEYIEPERLYISKELGIKIQEEICRLPPRCQLIFRMIREDGLKYREVAQILDISLKAVENQLAIALKRMRPSLEKYVNRNPKSPFRQLLFW